MIYYCVSRLDVGYQSVRSYLWNRYFPTCRGTFFTKTYILKLFPRGIQTAVLQTHRECPKHLQHCSDFLNIIKMQAHLYVNI